MAETLGTFASLPLIGFAQDPKTVDTIVFQIGIVFLLVLAVSIEVFDITDWQLYTAYFFQIFFYGMSYNLIFVFHETRT